MPGPVILRSWLEISGVPLAIPAFWTRSLRQLRTRAARGEDQLLPGSAGYVARRRRRTGVRMAFPLVIDGAYDLDGALRSDPWAGLDANTDYLMANVVEPITTGNGTRPAVWHRSDGTTKSADVHVLSLGPPTAAGPTVDFTVLDLSVPAGRFT